MHLFPDAEESLSIIYPDYPLTNVLVCFGIILVLGIDQIATTSWRRLHPIVVSIDHVHDHDHAHPNGDIEMNSSPDSRVVPYGQDHDHESHHENCGFMTCEHSVSASATGNKGTQKIAADKPVVDSDRTQSQPLDLGIAAQAFMQEESFKDIVTAYIMEFSIAAHSIIIGINLGLLGEDDISSIVALMIALGFHQVSVCSLFICLLLSTSYTFTSCFLNNILP